MNSFSHIYEPKEPLLFCPSYHTRSILEQLGQFPKILTRLKLRNLTGCVPFKKGLNLYKCSVEQQ